MGFELDRVREIVERVAASSGLEVVEVELRGSGKARMLRIVIDKLPGPGESNGDKPVAVTHRSDGKRRSAGGKLSLGIEERTCLRMTSYAASHLSPSWFLL